MTVLSQQEISAWEKAIHLPQVQFHWRDKQKARAWNMPQKSGRDA